MKKKITKTNKLRLWLLALMLLPFSVMAQKSDTTTFKPHGKISGYAFGDYYYKAYSDSLNRGDKNQYTGIPKGRNAFQFRRIYLGYDYYISPKFKAQVLLDAESTGGGKYTFYIKYANLQWKNILPRTNLIIGQTSTPAFSNSSEKLWGYRSIEKTIADRRGTPSYDFGIKIEGQMDKGGRFGYSLMVGNGSGAKPEVNNFKHFYGDAYAKLFNKKLMIDLYMDYERLNWEANFHHSNSMGKLFIGYTAPRITIGTEGFIKWKQNGITATNIAAIRKDTLNGPAMGLSFFLRGPVLKDKLNFFARLDLFNPDTKFDGTRFTDYKSLSSSYSPDTKGQFITAGLDFMPFEKVHIMPNIWFNSYSSQKTGISNRDYDLVYRLTFYFKY